MPLSAGRTFAGYTIIRLLGSGAMGEVYLAQHPRLPRQDALKILRPDVSAEQDYRQRFIREADLAATLWHPNIVAVHDRGEEDDQLWIAMDYVDGTDAARLLGDQYPAGMPAGEVADIVTAIASALDNAHQHELLHRDVKPANILLANPVDGERRILLSDFGIARTTSDVSGLTATNMTMGTLPYASPEQLMGKLMDGRADQYSLAATAYHLLTGSPLFRESSPAAVIGSHLTTPPPPLATTRPELAALDHVLAVALAKDPVDRFARCRDFAAAFTEATQSDGPATAWTATMRAPEAIQSGDQATSWAATVQAPEATQAAGPSPPRAATVQAPVRGWYPKPRGRAMILAAASVTAAVVIGLTVMATNHGGPVALPFTDLNEPSSVAVDSGGTAYVTDPFNHRVLKLRAGSSAQTVLPFSDLKRPRGVAVDSDGAVYVADTDRNQVLKLAAGSSTQMVLPFTDLGEPTGVAVDGSRAVYVADREHNRVLTLAPGASAQTALPFTDLVKPVGVAIGRSGAVYVVNEEWHPRVVKLAGESDKEHAVLPGYWPEGIAVDSGGAVYVTDTGDRRVLKLPARCISARPGTSWLCGHVNPVRAVLKSWS